MRNNPGKSAVVSLSLIAGVRAGSVLPGLGMTILGAGGAQNWFFHSALPIVGIRKLTERYDAYLKEQEKRIAEGNTDEAEKGSDRIPAQSDEVCRSAAARGVQRSCRSDSDRLGVFWRDGNRAPGEPAPGRQSTSQRVIWFFANGVVCISEGYRLLHDRPG